MREICMSGLMSGEGKRSVAAWPKPPRPSSTLLKAQKNDDLDAAALVAAAGNAWPFGVDGTWRRGSD
jgi:hypothetical protein